jgi:predicted aspartyl protease
MVDTGATYTWLPKDILDEIGIRPSRRMPFVMADGRQIQRDIGTVVVRIDDRQHPSPCIFGDPGSLALLGAVTLDELGLGPDPMNQKLIEITGYLLLADE